MGIRKCFLENAILCSLVLVLFTLSISVESPLSGQAARAGYSLQDGAAFQASGSGLGSIQTRLPNVLDFCRTTDERRMAGCVADTADKVFFMKIALASASETERKMLRAAVSASSAKLRQTREAYETEYRNSITEGGKSSSHDSANSVEWRDALQSTQST
ncbi:MAG: hypothetical protein LBS93_00180 [Synergistaceae bacterium]|nr:hypothetical protein [Synergistaceae bacterium]